jgi:hypothetical protein
MWGLIAKAAGPKIADGDPKLAQDLAVGRAYVERALPETALRLARITASADRLMAVPATAL